VYNSAGERTAAILTVLFTFRFHLAQKSSKKIKNNVFLCEVLHKQYLFLVNFLQSKLQIIDKFGDLLYTDFKSVKILTEVNDHFNNERLQSIFNRKKLNSNEVSPK